MPRSHWFLLRTVAMFLIRQFWCLRQLSIGQGGSKAAKKEGAGAEPSRGSFYKSRLRRLGQKRRRRCRQLWPTNLCQGMGQHATFSCMLLLLLLLLHLLLLLLLQPGGWSEARQVIAISCQAAIVDHNVNSSSSKCSSSSNNNNMQTVRLATAYSRGELHLKGI